MATVHANGRRRVVSALAVPGVRPGDWAILAAGLLVRVLDRDAAEQMAAAIRLANAAPMHDKVPRQPMKGDPA